MTPAVAAVECSGPGCSAAVLRAGAPGEPGCVHVESAAPERAGAEHLLALLDTVMGGPLQAASLDALAFGRGPGAFTSVRTTVSLAHGLSLATALPLVPVSTLEALAISAIVAHGAAGAPVLALTDARLGEVYAGLYAPMPAPGAGGLEIGARPVVADALLAPGEVGAWAVEALGAQAAHVALGKGKELTVAGNALILHADSLHLDPLERVVPRERWLRLPECAADAGAVARAAASRLVAGEPGVAPEQAPPSYLRERVADVPARVRAARVL